MNAPHDNWGPRPRFANPLAEPGLLCKNHATHPLPPCNPRAKVGLDRLGGADIFGRVEPGLQLACQACRTRDGMRAGPCNTHANFSRIRQTRQINKLSLGGLTSLSWHETCRGEFVGSAGMQESCQFPPDYYLVLISAQPGRLIMTSSLFGPPPDDLEEKRPTISPACLEAPNWVWLSSTVRSSSTIPLSAK